MNEFVRTWLTTSHISSPPKRAVHRLDKNSKLTTYTENLNMPRIWIIGASGSGKSTLARVLSQKFGAACVDLDELNWRPNWQQTSPAELLAAVELALSAPSWVVAGNYSRIQSHFLKRADTIIWLDYSFPLVLWRQLKRIVRRVVFNEPCCNGNQETLRRALSRDSILLWLLMTFHRRRRQAWNTKRRARLNGTRFLHFRRPRDCARWLASIRQTRGVQ